MTMRGRFEHDPDAAEIRQAMDRIAKVAPLAPVARSGTVSLDSAGDGDEALAVPDQAATPEEQLVQAEEEQSRSELLEIVRAAAAELPAQDRLYLQIVSAAADPLPAREIARAMQLPVEEVYRLKQRAQRWLAGIAGRLEKK